MSDDPRIIGGKYRSGYWGQEYLVTDIPEPGWFVCLWENGRTTTHCTAWDPRRDRVIA